MGVIETIISLASNYFGWAKADTQAKEIKDPEARKEADQAHAKEETAEAEVKVIRKKGKANTASWRNLKKSKRRAKILARKMKKKKWVSNNSQLNK